MTNSLWSLPRNDIAAALDFYRAEKRRRSAVSEDVIRVLAKLQDDPHDFFAALEKLNQ